MVPLWSFGLGLVFGLWSLVFVFGLWCLVGALFIGACLVLVLGADAWCSVPCSVRYLVFTFEQAALTHDT